MNNAYIFILIVIMLFALVVSYTIYEYNSVVRKATKKYIISVLQNKGYSFLKIERISNPFAFNKKKGDFDDEHESVFHDTKYNRKVYAYVYYADKNGTESRVTVKIYCNVFVNPFKVEFKPTI